LTRPQSPVYRSTSNRGLQQPRVTSNRGLQQPEKNRTGVNKKTSTLLKIAVSAALAAVLVIKADLKAILAAISGFDLRYAPAVLAMIYLAVMVSARKWGALLTAQGCRVSQWKLFQYYTAGFFFNNFLPSSIGCDGVRVMLLKAEIRSYARAASSVVLERILAAVTLGLLGLAGAIWAASPSTPVIVCLAAVSLTGLLLALVQLTGFVPKKLQSADTKFARAWRDFASSSASLRGSPRAILVCLAESAIFQIAVSLSQAAIMLGLGLPFLPIADLFYVSAAASVVSMIPLGVNGYGFREGGFIYLLRPLGIDAASAFAVSLLFALFVSAYSLLGAVFWVTLRNNMKSAHKEHEARGNTSGNTKGD